MTEGSGETDSFDFEMDEEVVEKFVEVPTKSRKSQAEVAK